VTLAIVTDRLEDGMNPIKRVPLVVSGGDNKVVIEVLVMDDGEIGELQDIRQGLNRRDEQVRMQNSLIILQLRRELVKDYYLFD
jgi:hypothetical protein